MTSLDVSLLLGADLGEAVARQAMASEALKSSALNPRVLVLACWGVEDVGFRGLGFRGLRGLQGFTIFRVQGLRLSQAVVHNAHLRSHSTDQN